MSVALLLLLDGRAIVSDEQAMASREYRIPIY